jgi:ComF family protein
MKLINNLLSLFYPRLCAACGDALQQNEQCICLNCMLHLPETQFHKEHFNPLRRVFDGRVPVEEVTALMSYKKANKVQKILHHLKYSGRKEIGKILGEYFGGQLITEERYRNIQYILPIPLHPKKQKKRGYNQSEWIAMGLSKGMGIPYLTDVLVRTHYTDTQTRKSRFARWQNVKEVFEVQNPDKVAYTHVLVCDDVLTTGATTEAAIHKLLEVEGVKVSVVTLAATTL